MSRAYKAGRRENWQSGGNWGRQTKVVKMEFPSIQYCTISERKFQLLLLEH